MNITLYDILQDSEQHPTLISEGEHTYDATDLSDPAAVVDMLNAVFQADRQVEEHLYMIALSAANKVLGVFSDVSRGTQTATLVNARSVFTRAMLAGAAGIALAHNHPSGGTEPSRDDVSTCKRIKEAGNILGIPMLDFIIIGKHGAFRSFCRDGLCSLNSD